MNVKKLLLDKYPTGIIFGLISLVLFIGRIISFRENSLDPDELEYMYAIRRCLENPSPFVGFDAHTSGPFAIYVLSFFKLVTGFSKLYQLRLISFFFFMVPSLFLVAKSAQKGTAIMSMVAFGILVQCFNVPFFGQYYDGIFCYNTEYQLMVFTALLFWIVRYGKGPISTVFYAFLLFVLPFVKFQALPLTAFFGIFLVGKLAFEKKYQQVVLLITTYLVFNLLWFGFLFLIGNMDDFYFAYIEKNFEYISSDAFGQEKINPLNFFNRFNPYYGFLWIFILLVGYKWVTSKTPVLKQLTFGLFQNPVFQSMSFFLVAVLSIILGKNDYGHYYILLFVPAAIFVGDVYQSFPTFSPVFYIVLLMHFNYTVFSNSCRLVVDKIQHKPIDQYTFGKPFSSLVNEEMKSYLLANKVPNAAILSLGWTQSHALYYELQYDFDLTYRSSQCSYYERAFREKNLYMFKKEEQVLFEDLTKKMPYFIVDTWDLVTKFKGTALPAFVAKHYELKLKRKEFAIFQLKKQ